MGLAIITLILAGCGTTSSWQDYQNNEFGFNMKHPTGWQFEAQTVSSPAESSLDIHLSNMAMGDSLSCPKDFIGLELQVGLNRDGEQDFATFAKSLAVTQDGLGVPSGELKELQINGRTVFQAEKSGWDSPCTGRGYIIEQDKTHYAYIFTGSDEMNQKNTEPNVIMEIVSSVRF